MFDLHISTVNAAFDDSPMLEIARILREVAAQLQEGDDYRALRDSNGNTVGDWSYKA